MKIAPDTTIRIANTEETPLELAVDSPIGAVRLLPRFGDESVIEVDGPVVLPKFVPPNVVRIEWLESASSTEASFVTYAKIVSRHYFTLEQLKAKDEDQDAFAELPDDELFMARQAATEVFELNSGRSFVHQIGRTKDYGRDSLLYLDHGDIYEILTDGYSQVSGSQLVAQSPFGAYPKWVEYLYGADDVPAQVSQAVLELAAYTLRPSNRAIGATGESTEAGYIHFTIAGRDGATAIPEVNAAIEQFGRGVGCVW